MLRGNTPASRNQIQNPKNAGLEQAKSTTGPSRSLLAMTDFRPHATFPTANFSTSLTRSLRSHGRLVPGCVTFSVNADFTGTVNWLQLRRLERPPSAWSSRCSRPRNPGAVSRTVPHDGSGPPSRLSDSRYFWIATARLTTLSISSLVSTFPR